MVGRIGKDSQGSAGWGIVGYGRAGDSREFMIEDCSCKGRVKYNSVARGQIRKDILFLSRADMVNLKSDFSVLICHQFQ